MDKTKFLKKSVLRLGIITILLIIDMIILQGGFFTSKVSAIPVRASLAVRAAAEEKPEANLKITSFTGDPQSQDGVFRKSSAITFSCSIENTSENTTKNFKSLIRTPKKEIVSKTVSLAPKKTLILEGEFTPEETGMLIIACRADIEQIMLESDENDNREIFSLSISK